MSRTKKIWLIVAACLCGCGGLMMASVFLFGISFADMETGKYVTNEYADLGEVRGIAIDTDTADVSFLPSEDGTCRVVCHEETRAKHSVQLTDGLLSVKIHSTRKWYDFINVSFESASVTVYLPAGIYETLSVKTDTGDVRVPDKFSFGELDISTDTGDIVCNGAVTGNVTLATDTGDVHLSATDAGALSVRTSTGNVRVDGTRVSAGLTAKTSTGEITLDGVIAEEAMEITSSTGNVRLSQCDASRLQIKTSTGEVEATLLSEKSVDADSSTGDVDVPRNGRGGACVIRTSTGDIRVRITEK